MTRFDLLHEELKVYMTGCLYSNPGTENQEGGVPQVARVSLAHTGSKDSAHDTSGYFPIADTDSIKPIDKRARKAHGW